MLTPLLRAMLWPASLVFEAGVRLRAGFYRDGIFQPRRLGGSVISVGNLTVGGTGKTPMVIWIAERLIGEGKRVGILTRGYRGFGGPDRAGITILPAEEKETHLEELGDEVLLLQSRFGGRVSLSVGADRYAAGRLLEQRGVEWFLLDDGFQHLRLARDADIVVLDATDPFGGGRLLPAGRLREPRSALARADMIVVTRSELAPAVEAVARRFTRAPLFYAQTELEGVYRVCEACAETPADWHKKKLFAFCGIGNSTAFFDDLRRWRMRIVGQLTFPDHHRYTQRDADRLEQRAQATGAEALLCTEKDVFNLVGVRFNTLPACYCRMTLRINEPENFWQAILAAVQRKRSRAIA